MRTALLVGIGVSLAGMPGARAATCSPGSRLQLCGGDGNDRLIDASGDTETVDCGDGAADDAEPDPLDTFSGCEL